MAAADNGISTSIVAAGLPRLFELPESQREVKTFSLIKSLV
jgi:hypothetical protein